MQPQGEAISPQQRIEIAKYITGKSE